MKTFPWNEKIVHTNYYDRYNDESIYLNKSLKEHLKSPKDSIVNDMLMNICESLVMVMDYIEKQENGSNPPEDEL